MAGKRAHGEGTVYRASPSLWRGRVMVDGKMRWVSAKTKAECAAKLHKAAQDARAGQAQPDSQVTVAQYMAGWLEGARDTVRPQTWRVYEQHVRLHIVPAVGPLKLVDLSPLHVTSMLGRVQAGGASARTALHVRATLRRAIADAVRTGVVGRNVAALAQAPRVQPPEPRWLDASEAERFLATAQGDPAGDFLSFVLLLGLRRGEALGLKWSDIDFARSLLLIQRTLQRREGTYFEDPPKSKASRRTLPLPAPVLAILQRQQQRQAEDRAIPGWKDTGFVWTAPDGEPRGNTWATLNLRRILDAAALPRVRLHDLRHSTASILLERGVPARVVADLLGHSGITLTLSTYSHVTARLVEGATEVLASLTKPDSPPLSQ